MKKRHPKHAIFLLGGLLAVSAQAEMAIRADAATQRYTLEDAGRPVLTYNFGLVPVPTNVSGKYAVARGNYVHPLYGPSGEVLTTDYSPDHPHHRGLYWAWPEVTYKGDTRDLHALQGVFARPVRIVRQEASSDTAVLEAENVWKWGDAEEIVREVATLTVTAARDGLQVIDFHFRFAAIKPSVALARRGQSAYGGFNVRLSPRQDQVITKHTGSAAVFPQTAWAELTGVAPGGKGPVGVFLLQKPSNPGYPGDWQEYANLNWLQPTFPAKGTAYALEPGKPLELAYRMIIRSGEGLKADPAALFAAYAADFTDPLAALANYKTGDSRVAMTRFEESVKKLAPTEHPAAEQRLLALLAAHPSPEFTRWACRQLQLVGSAVSIRTLAPFLKEEEWQEACDTLLSLPGADGASALLAALPALAPERRATVIHALGLRRHAAAAPVLAPYAQADDKLVREATLEALGRIATPEAAELLLTFKPAGDAVNRTIEARLQCAAALHDGPKASALYALVRSDAAATAAQKAAALIGWAKLAPAESADAVLAALSDRDAHMRRGAAAALRALDRKSLEQTVPLFSALPREAQLVLLSAWGEQRVTAAEPAVIQCLRSADDDLKLASVRALRQMGSAAAVQRLLTLAVASGEVGRDAEASLLQLKAGGVAAALQTATKTNDAKRATAAINLLAERKDPGHSQFLLGLVAGGDEKQSETALTALKRCADGDTLATLREALDTLPAQQQPVAQTILSICKRQAVPPAQQAVELKASLRSLRDDNLREQFKELLATLSKQNLALGKQVSTSHPWQGNLRPELAIDGDPETYWSCAFSPAWIRVDLEKPTPLSRIKVVNFVDGIRYYQYRAELSLDGKAWSCVGDMSTNTAPATKEGATHTFQTATARYVRVTVLKNSANPGMHISELGIYGGE